MASSADFTVLLGSSSALVDPEDTPSAVQGVDRLSGPGIILRIYSPYLDSEEGMEQILLSPQEAREVASGLFAAAEANEARHKGDGQE